MATAALALALHLATGPVTRSVTHPLPPSAVQVAQVAQATQTPPPADTPQPLWPANEPEASPPPPRFEFDAAFLLALGQPLTPGLALRGRVRLIAGLWAHAGASARAGSLSFDAVGDADPVSAGIREIPFELGLGYRLPLGEVFSLGLRGEALVMSRRMVVANADPQHRWLAALRGGVEVRVKLHEQLGLVLLVGAEGRLGRTEAVLGTGREVFSPVAPYLELGPSLYF